MRIRIIKKPDELKSMTIEEFIQRHRNNYIGATNIEKNTKYILLRNGIAIGWTSIFARWGDFEDSIEDAIRRADESGLELNVFSSHKELYGWMAV